MIEITTHLAGVNKDLNRLHEFYCFQVFTNSIIMEAGSEPYTVEFDNEISFSFSKERKCLFQFSES